MTSPSMLTVREIAKDLQLTTATVQRKLKTGEIPGGAIVFGDWRVDADTYYEYRENLFKPATPADPYGFTPRSARSEAARRARQGR